MARKRLIIFSAHGPYRVHQGPCTLVAGTWAFWVPKVIVCCPNTLPDSVVAFFFDFGTPVAVGPVKGPEGLACCCYLLLARRAGSTPVV